MQDAGGEQRSTAEKCALRLGLERATSVSQWTLNLRLAQPGVGRLLAAGRREFFSKMEDVLVGDRPRPPTHSPAVGDP